MSTARSVALALVLVLVLTLPAFAQRPQPTQTVTKTWTLTLHGDVPPGESFGVEYRDPAGREVAPLFFCGAQAAVTCAGQGRVYRGRVTEAVTSVSGRHIIPKTAK